MIRHSLLLAGTLAMCGMLFGMVGGCQPGAQSGTASKFVQITQPSFVKAWDVQLRLHPGDSIKGIYFLDGTIHVLTNQNYDHAVKGDSGELLYQNEIGTPESTLMGGPTLVKSGIAFPMTHTLEIYTRGGNFTRSIDLKSTLTNQAVGNKDNVYVGLDFKKGCVGQVDVTQEINPIQWTYLTFGPVDGPVAFSSGGIFSGSEDGKVRACLEDRSPYWPLLTDSAFDAQSKILAGIAVDGHSVYFGTISGMFYCLDQTSGKVKWQYSAGQSLEFTPQVTDTAVYQYVPGLGLASLEKTKKMTLASGETIDEAPFHTPKWTLGSAGRILAEDDQFVYVVLGAPDQTRGLAAVDKQTGKIKFRTHRRDIAFVASTAKGDLIYAATTSGLIMALKPVSEPGSYGEIAEYDASPVDGLTAHVR